jgi:hypothetical protein
MTPFLRPAQIRCASHARPTRPCLPSSDLPFSRGLVVPLRYLRPLVQGPRAQGLSSVGTGNNEDNDNSYHASDAVTRDCSSVTFTAMWHKAVTLLLAFARQACCNRFSQTRAKITARALDVAADGRPPRKWRHAQVNVLRWFMSCDREPKNGDMRNILPRREMTQFCVLGPDVKCVRAAVSTSQMLCATDSRSARTIVSVLSIDASVDSAFEPNDPGAHHDPQALASWKSGCHEGPVRWRAKKESANRSPPVSTGWADGPPAHSPRKVVPRIPENSNGRPVQGSSAFFCEINRRTRSANSAPSNGFLNASLNPSAKVSSPGSSLVKASRIVPT